MEISIDITKFEHKESKTGQRAIDLTIIQEKNGTFTMTMENVNTFNLALVMFGTKSVVAGAAVVGELVPIFTDGGRYGLDHMNLDDTVSPVITITEAVAGVPWAVSTAKIIGDVVTAVAAPATPPRFMKAQNAGTTDGTTEPTWTETLGAIDLDNDINWVDQGIITPVEGTDIVFDYPHGTIVMTIGSVGGGNTIDVDYTHLGYSRVDALTDTSRVRWLRFEGLNTVDDEPVVVDIYKASLDPLSGYGLINEEVAQMEVTGNVLLDDLRTVGDQFFRQRQAADVDNSGTNPEQ